MKERILAIETEVMADDMMIKKVDEKPVNDVESFEEAIKSD